MEELALVQHREIDADETAVSELLEKRWQNGPIGIERPAHEHDM